MQVSRLNGPAVLRRAFTLIELLVVIAIIALLISILIPALHLAKNEGAAAKCQAHIRGIVQATTMYWDDREDDRGLPWYQYPPHTGYAVNLYTPWVFGGFKALKLEEPGYNMDSFMYPTEIRPLNKYVDNGAIGNQQIDLYKCPVDRTNQTSIIGLPPGQVEEQWWSSWEANGTSFTFNTRFMQGYKGPAGNFTVPDTVPFGKMITKHLVGGKAAQFIIWVEQGFYSATYKAGPTLPTSGAVPQRFGWHRKWSTWSLGFADGHVRYMYYDTRLVYGPDGSTIWQPGYYPPWI